MPDDARPAPRTDISIPLGFLNDLASARSMEEFYEKITSRIPEFVASDRISIALPVADGKMNVVSVGGVSLSSRDGDMPMDGTGVGLCFQTRQKLHVTDSFAIEDRRFDIEPLRRRGLRSVVLLPLLVGDDCVGTLNVARAEPNAFSDEDIESLSVLSAWIANQIRFHETLRRLEQSENRLNTLIDHADSQIFAKTRDGEMLLVNRKYCEARGVEREATVGHYDWEVYGEETAAKWRKDDERVMETGETVRVEAMIKGPDGVTRPHIVSKFPIFDPVRGEDIICAIATDVSAMRAMQSDLSNANTVVERARERLRLTQASVDLAAEPILWVDPDGTVRYANTSAAELLEYGAFEILALKMADIDPSTAEARWSEIVERVRGSDGIEFTSEFRSNTGRMIPVEATARYVKTDRSATICIFFHDQTNRIWAQAALEESERRFRTFFDHSPSLMYMKDQNRILRFVNKTYLEFNGLTEVQVIGRKGGIRLPQQQMAFVEKIDQRVMDSGGVVHSEATLTAANGETRTFMVTKFPVYDADGQVTGIGGINTDVTELRDREEQLRIAMNEAERAARRFEEAAVKAEAADLAKSEFLASMSHEIRTPLNGVLGMTSLLLDTALDDDQRDKLITIRESGSALLSILNDILDLSKVESNRLELEHTDFDLVTLMRSVEDMWAPQARAKGLDWRSTSAPLVARWLQSDSGRIRQVLFNLIANAIKFTTAGGIEIRVSQRAHDGGMIETRFEIEDTGPGIPSGIADRLFEKFTQADSSIARRYGGTGLGLAISRGLVGLLGGDIGLETKPGEGSLFWFTVLCPMAAAEDIERPGEPAAKTERSGRSLRILVAEDNHVNQKVVTVMLENAGHRIDIAANGIEAVEAVRSRNYDLVLMDIQMPEMDGISATRRIRELPPPACDVPIIALTANAMKGDQERYLDAGMNDYVPKPIDPARLARAIGRHTATYSDIAAIAPSPAAAIQLDAADRAALDDMFASFEGIGGET